MNNDAAWKEYRKFLEDCETQATSDFDKTVVALSGGALGISLAFLKDFAPQPASWAVVVLLTPAWLALVISLLGVLMSFMASMKSMRYELQCLDGIRAKPEGEQAGGIWRTWTEEFNHAALIGCILGILLLGSFVIVNIGRK